MWIRSQNKNVLVDCSSFYIKEPVNITELPIYPRTIDTKTCDFFTIGCNFGPTLGCYSTKEKALKVLDDIQKRIITCECAKMKSNMMDRCFHPVIKEATLLVFEMPEDDEVNIHDI